MSCQINLGFGGDLDYIGKAVCYFYLLFDILKGEPRLLQLFRGMLFHQHGTGAMRGK